MRINEAKQIPITHIMQQLGYEAQYSRKNGNEWWYCSPFRPEKKPSFKITIDKNTWYDFGIGEGGTVIDFLMKFKNTNVSGVLVYLDSVQGIYTPSYLQSLLAAPKPLSGESHHIIQDFKPLTDAALLYYLRERAINTNVAHQVSQQSFASQQAYFGELHYLNNEKPYFAIALKNEKGGYDLRCKVFKGCIGVKAITVIPSTSDNEIIHLFEGFIDWLSLLTIVKRNHLPGTTIILNSTLMVSKAIAFIEKGEFTDIRTYFDNDVSGQKAYDKIVAAFPQHSIIDKRTKYAAYNDLNAMLIAQ